jgi:WD40 repeat protein
VSFSRDGHLLAAKGGRTIRVWNTDTWQEQFYSTNGGINWFLNSAVVISPDNTTLASPVLGGVGVWDLRTQQQLPAPLFRDDQRYGSVMVYSRDGQVLAVSDQTVIEVRDARSLLTITNLVRPAPPGLEFGLRVLALTFSSRFLAAGYRDGSIEMWDLKTWGSMGRFRPHSSFVIGLDFSPDGQVLASGGTSDDLIYLWEVKALVAPDAGSRPRKPLGTLKGQAKVNSLAFSPDGRTLAATGPDGTTKLWTVSFQTDQRIVLDRSSAVLWFSRDGKSLIAGTGEDKLERWSNQALAKGEDSWEAHTFGALEAKVIDLPPMPTEIQSINCLKAISPDGKKLAYEGTNSILQVWDLATGTHVEPFPPDETTANQLEFSPDSRLLFTAHGPAADGRGGGLRIRDPAAPNQSVLLEHLASPFAISPDTQVLAARDRRDHSPRIELWDIQARHSLGGVGARLGSQISGMLAFSPDGRLLVTTSHDDGLIQVWDVRSKGNLVSLPMVKEGVTSLAFAPDGKTLLMGGVSNTLRFWNVATWEEMMTESDYFPRGGPSLFPILFSPDGRYLATQGGISASGEAPWILWRAPTLAEIDGVEGGRAGGPQRRP